MRLLTFDGRAGASGDMLLAAAIAAGAAPAALAPVEDALPVEYRVDERTERGIRATTVDVVLTDSSDDATDAAGAASDDGHDGDRGDGRHDDEGGHDHHDESDHGGDDHDHRHHHDHGDDHHDHGEAESHDHDRDDSTPAEGHGPHRSYREVVDIVEGMGLPAAVERDALEIFELLGEAEAAVHGTDLEATHFHEVGADDAIADVVGAALLFDDLAPDRIVTTPLSAGGGTVSMSHGEYPVPAPAVVEIAERADWSLRGGPVDRELLTPTGAAVLGHYAAGVDDLPSIALESSGYGAGGYDLGDRPNVLRALVGTTSGNLRREEIAVLETNLDDATPEVLGGLHETLADAGARDVSIVPTTMKKSRPGHLVKVVCKPGDRRRVARRLAEETGTLGIRDAGTTHRWIAAREFETATLEVEGERHEVAVKVASDDDGAVYDVSAEYDDAAAVAAETGLAVRTVLERAERAIDARLEDRD